MFSRGDAAGAARRILADHRARRPYRRLTDLLPAGDLQAAYDTQEALHALMAREGAGDIVGYKIALTSKAMQELVGVDRPLAGALFSSRVHTSPARLPADRFQHVGIECEMAVRLGVDLPASRAPYDRETVAPAVAACMPAFELVEDRDADYGEIDAVSLVADNCWNGGNVLAGETTGTPSRWLSDDFVQARTRLSINSAVVGEGRVGDAMGHPFEAVAWVANLLADRGRSLAGDMIVMTGSTVLTQFPAPGDLSVFSIEGLGKVELTLTD